MATCTSHRPSVCGSPALPLSLTLSLPCWFPPAPKSYGQQPCVGTCQPHPIPEGGEGRAWAADTFAAPAGFQGARDCSLANRRSGCQGLEFKCGFDWLAGLAPGCATLGLSRLTVMEPREFELGLGKADTGPRRECLTQGPPTLASAPLHTHTSLVNSPGFAHDSLSSFPAHISQHAAWAPRASASQPPQSGLG